MSQPRRSPGWTSRLGRAALVAALAATPVAVWAAPASADLVDPPGSCAGTLTWTGAGFTVDSATADPAEVIEVPRADDVTWTGSVAGTAPAERQVAGTVSLALPFPLGAVTIADWSGPATNVSTSGTHTYDLPALVPAGVVFSLRAEHHENGELVCTGAARLRIAGSPFGSPLTWVALVLTVLLGALAALVGLGGSGSAARLVGGAVLGVLFGAFAGMSLVLLGLSALDSPSPMILAVLGLVGGGAWSQFPRLRQRRAAREPSLVGK